MSDYSKYNKRNKMGEVVVRNSVKNKLLGGTLQMKMRLFFSKESLCTSKCKKKAISNGSMMRLGAKL